MSSDDYAASAGAVEVYPPPDDENSTGRDDGVVGAVGGVPEMLKTADGDSVGPRPSPHHEDVIDDMKEARKTSSGREDRDRISLGGDDEGKLAVGPVHPSAVAGAFETSMNDRISKKGNRGRPNNLGGVIGAVAIEDPVHPSTVTESFDTSINDRISKKGNRGRFINLDRVNDMETTEGPVHPSTVTESFDTSMNDRISKTGNRGRFINLDRVNDMETTEGPVHPSTVAESFDTSMNGRIAEKEATMGKVKKSKKKALPKVQLRQVEVSSGGDDDIEGTYLDRTSKRGEVASGAVDEESLQVQTRTSARENFESRLRDKCDAGRKKIKLNSSDDGDSTAEDAAANEGTHFEEASERGEVASCAVDEESPQVQEASERGDVASRAVNEETLQVLIDRKSSSIEVGQSRRQVVHHDSLDSTEKLPKALRRTSTPFIPEAYLVESFGAEEAGNDEMPVYVGTEVEDVPWWKLKQTKLLIGCLLCAVPITLIAGLYLGSGRGGSPICNVGDPSKIGDGECDGGGYNTEACDWDGGDCAEFNEKYPNCIVDKVEKIGDGFCHYKGKGYNTEECGWDGGDCKEVDGYPGCHVGHPSKIGDGECDGGGYNTEACDWDGGDCAEFKEKYPNCNVDNLERIGDGFCHRGKGYNTEECGWDGGDCKEVRGYPNCRVGRPKKIGDGNCDDGGYNTEECGWDGGDCL